MWLGTITSGPITMEKTLVLSLFCVILTVCSVTSDDCLRPCPLNIDYVCGTDGQTYPNTCSLSVAACRAQQANKPALRRAYSGKCGRESPALKDRPHFYQMTPEIQKKLAAASEKSSRNNCLRPCPRNFDFVCGSNGKTYSNPCVMQVEACEQRQDLTVRHKGPCAGGQGSGALMKMLLAVREVCPVMCPANYAPVCGDDDRTYPNECAMKYQGCKSKTVIRSAYSGPCKTFYRSPRRQVNETQAVVEGAQPGAQVGGRPGDCRRPCPLNLDRVCGTDGNTYPNMCAMETTACRKRLDIRLAHKGRC